jgi:lycopene beta-cyclase
MQLTHYDIILAGGGAASRILIHFLKQQPHFNQLNILMIEAENNIAEKTWCFWTDKNTPHTFEQLISKQWQELSFKSSTHHTNETIDPYRYCCIKGADFNDYFNNSICTNTKNLTLINDKIFESKQIGDQWQVTTTQQIFTCNKLVSNTHNIEHKPTLYQHFHGWFINYDTAVFDSNNALLMDFANTTNSQFCFFYVLPFSATHALVECTYYSPEAYDSNIYENEITNYLQNNYGTNYVITQKEKGAIPLHTTYLNDVASPTQIIIGQQAGMIKPSTGYAFERMVEDSKLLAASLLNVSTQRRARPSRFKFYDKLLLKIIQQEPNKAVSIFEQLFKNSSIKSILKFLDENSSLTEEIKIFARLPWWPFIKRIKLR